MVEIRKSEDRGYGNRGWLESYHSFSFAEYQDPAHMQYSVLRVINEDVIAGGGGFGMHPHHDMEIVTYILSGALQHKDSMGNGSVIGVGDVQRMSAGTGVRHSEFNASADQPVHLLQIWMLPETEGLTPSYEEKHFAKDQKENQWCLIVSPNGDKDSVRVNQDALLYSCLLTEGHSIAMPITQHRCHYLQVATGSIVADGRVFNAGDAIKIEDETMLNLKATSDTELLWFNLPKV